MVLLAACAGQEDRPTPPPIDSPDATTTTEPRATPIPETPEPLDEDTDQDEDPAFDLALVKSNFSDECVDPVIVDDLFCTQVDIGAMTANGPFLTVPTALSASGMDDRAAVICDQIAIAHFDGATGDPLGFETIVILDRNGGTAAECRIRE